MAQYPNAVISFTTKNAGDTIQPSHINTMQDEITALEDGLLNGTAPVNSLRITAPAAQIGNCTVSSLTVTTFNAGALTSTNLSVSGGSTLAAVSATSLSVSGGSTLADLRVLANPLTARLSAGSLVPIASGSTTRLTFNTQDYVSTSGLHSTTSNPSRINLISSGVWVITASATWSIGSTAGIRLVRLLIDGSSVIAASRVTATVGGDVVEQSVTAVYRAASTTAYAEVEVFQNSGSTASLAITDNRPTFAAAQLR